MNGYTLTTETIRERFADAYGNYENGLEDFDRWLAAHDAEVMRKEFATGKWELHYPCPHWNPHRITLRRGCTSCHTLGIKPVPVEREGAET